MTDAKIAHMANRFLNWKLPDGFNPDGGISFEKIGNKGTPHEYKREPVGTNLLGYADAVAMVRHMLEGLPQGDDVEMDARRDIGYQPGERDAPRNAKDQADCLAQLLYRRNAHARDLIGGSNAQILNDAIAEIARLRSTSKAEVPEGWQLVPKEPTEEMLLAAQRAVGDHSDPEDWLEDEGREIAQVFRALLSAAPPPPHPTNLALQATSVVQDGMREALEPFGNVCGEGSSDFPDETPVTIKFGRTTHFAVKLGDFRRARAALAAAPTMDERPQCDGHGALTRTRHDQDQFGPVVVDETTQCPGCPACAPTIDAVAEERAIADIAAERRRQIETEGWTPEHGDTHDKGELADAAACYASPQSVGFAGAVFGRLPWPFERQWFKPRDARKNLIRAGALIVAEIERLDRAAIRARGTDGGTNG